MPRPSAKAEQQNRKRSVLLVESSADERQVLRIALERRGLRIWEAAAASEGLEIAQEEHPDVIVLDLHSQSAERAEIEQQFAESATGHDGSLVILGKLRRRATNVQARIIEKPYHFAPLIHTIEQLAAKAA